MLRTVQCYCFYICTYIPASKSTCQCTCVNEGLSNVSTALCPRCPNKQLKILCASLVLHPFSRSGLSMIVFLVRSDLKRQKVKYLENVWEVKWDNNRKQTNKNNRNYSLKPLFAYFSFWWTVPLLPFSINQHYTQRHQPQAMRSPSKCISICSVVVEFPELSMHSQRTMQIGIHMGP